MDSSERGRAVWLKKSNSLGSVGFVRDKHKPALCLASWQSDIPTSATGINSLHLAIFYGQSGITSEGLSIPAVYQCESSVELKIASSVVSHVLISLSIERMLSLMANDDLAGKIPSGLSVYFFALLAI
tara:strand:+ start:449 stop:832 length:384 start_codon:yes stop_codon:yes gene_type:complete